MSELARKIAAEIQNHGPMPFARFMELALYCPVYGYYEKEGDTVGRRGDFYTSVSVGSLFGDLLVFQFARWLEPLLAWGQPQGQGTIHLVEAGAHRGELARDILTSFRAHRHDLYERTSYWIVEPSERRRQWQQAFLAGVAGEVHWVSSLTELGTRLQDGVCGIIFSNELLDAFPVHRLGWDAAQRSWFEWGVGLEHDRFIWAKLSPKSAVRSPEPTVQRPESRIEGLAEVLPDGFVVETCPAAVGWWKEAAGLLSTGKLVAIDYGLTLEERFRPERAGGTLRSYHSHGVHSKVLDNPGQQDITAHVDFTAIMDAGEECGLSTDFLVSQMEFLTPIAMQMWKEDTGVEPPGPQAKRQFQTLIHPEHLGRAFRVLVQSRRG